MESHNLDVLRETRRADLKRRLKNANARLSRARADVEEIEGQLATLDHQDTLDVIRSWRGVPDWSLLLDSEWGGMARHMLCGFLLERMGLHHGCTWADNLQDVVAIGVYGCGDPAGDGEYVSRLRDSIEAIAPHVRPHQDGKLWFSIDGEGIDGFALTMRVSPDFSDVSIDRMHYGEVDDTERFATIGEALIHLQTKHPIEWSRFEDHRHPNNAPGGSGEVLREALMAFMEGCRSAGVPIHASPFGDLLPADAAE